MKRILLIAGHGESDPGATGNGYREADLTREIVALVKPELEKYAIVDIADTSKNWYKHRYSLDATPYNYVLEHHFNAIKTESVSDGATKGVEIYVTNAETGTAVEKNIVDKIAALGLKNRGVKKKDWSLIKCIKNQGVSAALLEVCYIDDIDDMQIYTSKKKQIASAIADGIAEGFGLKEPTDKNISNKEYGVLNMSQYEELKSEIQALKAAQETVYHYTVDVPDWARPTIQKLLDKGIYKGASESDLNLPESLMRTLVINDRAGLYDER